MRIPEFVVTSLLEISQGPYLAMLAVGESYQPENGHLKKEFALAKSLAQRIDSLIEEDSFELTDADRNILNYEKIVPALQALQEYFASYTPDASKFDIQDYESTVAFVGEALQAFADISEQEIRHSAWFSFLEGQNPQVDDYVYSFEQKSCELQCSFCQKTKQEVKRLIAGPSVYICNECIQRCNDITASEKELKVQPRKDA